MCRHQLQTYGKIGNFSIGKRDKFGQFIIPQKLYGREQEVAALMEAFERVSGGNSEMMLVSGYSGIGKSSLVNEVQKPILRQRGYFISGKFDQLKRNIPYASLIQAFAGIDAASVNRKFGKTSDLETATFRSLRLQRPSHSRCHSRSRTDCRPQRSVPKLGAIRIRESL